MSYFYDTQVRGATRTPQHPPTLPTMPTSPPDHMGRHTGRRRFRRHPTFPIHGHGAANQSYGRIHGIAPIAPPTVSAHPPNAGRTPPHVPASPRTCRLCSTENNPCGAPCNAISRQYLYPSDTSAHPRCGHGTGCRRTHTPHHAAIPPRTPHPVANQVRPRRPACTKPPHGDTTHGLR